MSDLRNRMERLGDRALVEEGAFERLERRRRRKVRNRRVGAAVLALVLTVGGSIAAFGAFSDGGSRVGGTVEEGFFALWPEQTRTEAEAVQEQAVAGDPELVWRLDPEHTAARFAREALLLGEGFTIDGMTAVNDDFDQRPGPVRLEIATPPPPCPTRTEGDPVCGPSTFLVTLERLLGPDGVWSVTAVESPELSLADYLGAEVVPGQTSFELPTSLPDGQLVSAGFSTTGSCQAAGETEVEVTDGLVRFQLQDGLTGCDGYLYLMHPATREGQVPIGRIMFIYGEPKPALDYHVQTMAAVPVRFVPEGSTGPVPDVARVTCDGSNTSVDTPVVAAQPDGVHIDIFNAGQEPLSFSWEFGGGQAGPDDSVTAIVGDAGGDTVEPGTTSTVWTFVPGSYVIVCHVPGVGEVTGMAPIEVIDAAGYYLPWKPECEGGSAWGMAPSYGRGELGDPGDPLDVARARLTGLEEGDVVERAGYPESAAEPLIRVVRGGTVIAAATLFDDGQGGWLLSSLEGCGGTQFGWSSDTPVPGGATGPEDPGTVCALALPATIEVTIVAQDLAFEPGCVVVPAGEPFTLTLVNRDAAIGHNISIYPRDSDEPIFRGEIGFGPDQLAYSVPGLEPGIYLLADDVHPETTRAFLLVPPAR